ncbi:HD domain-containing protein [Bdellovibrio sp. HCB-162]|uniref:HD domain-containing protein n=1 Tax=Bdellovibrio sp. HCB-162 TaxID=3394234 RepID=UPI0039BCC7F2
MTIESLLPFIKEIDRLKKIERQALIHNGGRRENSAEHSWHLAMTVLVLEKTSPQKIDIAKAVKMALLHDIVEIDAGDTMVYGDLSNKKASEAAALERIMGLLPNTVAEEFKSLWNEFEEGVSPEAKFVSAIDRFMPIFSNYLNEGYSWKNHKVTVDKVVAKCQPPISEGLPELWKVTERMLEESVAAGHLAR